MEIYSSDFLSDLCLKVNKNLFDWQVTVFIISSERPFTTYQGTPNSHFTWLRRTWTDTRDNDRFIFLLKFDTSLATYSIHLHRDKFVNKTPPLFIYSFYSFRPFVQKSAIDSLDDLNHIHPIRKVNPSLQKLIQIAY